MSRIVLVIVAAISLSTLGGCPPCDPWDDPNSPNDPNTPANENSTANANTNEPSDPLPLTTSGSFTGEILGTFQRQIDGVAQDALSQTVRVRVELDQGRLVSVRPFGPSGWYFGWVESAAVTNVGDTDNVSALTHTSSINETVTLTSYDVNDQRILFTIDVEFACRRGGNAEVINGTSTQTFELRPDGPNLNVVLTGDFDFTLVSQNPANPGQTTHRTEQFTGEGDLTPIIP